MLLLQWICVGCVQGSADDFLAKDQLLPKNFVAACADAKVPVVLRMQEVHMHSVIEHSARRLPLTCLSLVCLMHFFPLESLAEQDIIKCLQSAFHSFIYLSASWWNSFKNMAGLSQNLGMRFTQKCLLVLGVVLVFKFCFQEQN